MNFGDATQLIIDITHRPDKEAEIKSVINDGIALLASRPFASDTTSTSVTLDANSYIQSLDTSIAPFARFKKVKWIKPDGWKKYITYRDPNQMMINGCECLNVWYKEGVEIKFKTDVKLSSVIIGYYQFHQILRNANDRDWMLDQMWPAVKGYALATIFGGIGDDQERARFTAEYLKFWDIFYNDLGDSAEAH